MKEFLTDDDAADTTSVRRTAAAALANDLVQGGYEVAGGDAGILASYPELMPELAEELRNARMVRRAIETALRSGSPVDAVPLQVLTQEELEAPIELSPFKDEEPGGPDATASQTIDDSSADLPRIPGCNLVEEINRGSQGAVFRGIQESTGQSVAVKVLEGDSLADSRHRARFEREAQILAGIRHPYVVRLFDRGRTAEGAFYLIMEYVAGCDLDEWWTDRVVNTQAGTRRILEAFVKVCRGVDAGHAVGIIHRDLKPSNIRVDEQGEPRVLDFGLARRPTTGLAESPYGVRSVTVAGQILGSIPWASPEQAGGDQAEIGAASDVYSLGVILYQALTHRFPYSVEGRLIDVLGRIARSRVSPPSADRHSRRLGRRGALDAIVLKALAKSPADRYATAGELGEDLYKLLANRPVAALQQSARRGRRRAVFLTILVTAAGHLGVIGARQFRPIPPVVFELPSVQNSVGLRLVRLPSGTASLGSPLVEEGRDLASEAPHVITFPAFYIAITEVTQRQYEQVMGTNPSDGRWRDPDSPVQNVSWDDAMDFCGRLSKAEGRHYRLPTGDEWEYACRAGSQHPYGTTAGVGYVGWTAENSEVAPHRVGLKWPNSWGISDMHGNVAEWCLSAPPQPAPGAPQEHSIRGGGVNEKGTFCRSASSTSYPDHIRTPFLGFRIVLDP